MGIYTSIVKDLVRTEEGREKLFLLAVGVSKESQICEEEAVHSIRNEIYLRKAIDEAIAGRSSESKYLVELQKMLRSKEDMQCQMR